MSPVEEVILTATLEKRELSLLDFLKIIEKQIKGKTFSFGG